MNDLDILEVRDIVSKAFPLVEAENFTLFLLLI